MSDQLTPEEHSNLARQTAGLSPSLNDQLQTPDPAVEKLQSIIQQRTGKPGAGTTSVSDKAVQEHIAASHARDGGGPKVPEPSDKRLAEHRAAVERYRRGEI